MIKKIICTTICIALASTAVFAAAGFDDLPEDHWAVPTIRLAKENGIIEGYHESGTWLFRPDSNVSRQECVTMLYRTLAKAGMLDEELVADHDEKAPAQEQEAEGSTQEGAEPAGSGNSQSSGAAISEGAASGTQTGSQAASQAEDQSQAAAQPADQASAQTPAQQTPSDKLTEKWKGAMQSCGIAEWAYRYCAYAFEKGIVEISDFGSSGSAGFGGGVPASRQLIAKWTAKAMEYELSPLCRVVYGDYYDIDPENRVYVDALYRKHIMEGSDGIFHGADGVRRSEMAAVCTRLLGLDPKFAGTADVDPVIDVRGTLSSVSAGKGILKLSSPSAEFYIPEGVRVALDGTAAGISDLSSLEGKKISVSAFAGGENSVIVQTGPVVQRGTVKDLRDHGDHEAVSIELENGIRITLITDGDSDVPNIRKNRSYYFISDGILILEMR